MSRNEIRANSCKDCTDILTDPIESDLESELSFTVASPEEDVRRFTSQVCRGGLQRPSAVAFAICLKAWDVFSKIKADGGVYADFLASGEHKRLFLQVVEEAVTDDDAVYALVVGTFHCQSHNTLQNVTRRFFNCLAKNFVKELSSAKAYASARNRKN